MPEARRGACLRVLGLLPLLFVALHLVANWRAGTPGNLLWICHVANVVLGVGLLLDAPLLVRTGGIWAIGGLVPWSADLLTSEDVISTTFLVHGCGLVVALVAFRSYRARPRLWLHGFVLWLIAQQLSLHLSDPALNVNLIHGHWGTWKEILPSYPLYWLVCTTAATFVLWAINRWLLRYFPPQPDPGGVLHEPGDRAGVEAV